MRQRVWTAVRALAACALLGFGGLALWVTLVPAPEACQANLAVAQRAVEGIPIMKNLGVTLIHAGPASAVSPPQGFPDGSRLCRSDVVLSMGSRQVLWYRIDVETDGQSIVSGALGDEGRSTILGMR